MTETINDARTEAVTAEDRQIGLVGLAVMGENLAMNIAHHGFPISVTNRTTSRTEHFLAERGTEAGSSAPSRCKRWSPPWPGPGGCC